MYFAGVKDARMSTNGSPVSWREL